MSPYRKSRETTPQSTASEPLPILTDGQVRDAYRKVITGQGIPLPLPTRRVSWEEEVGTRFRVVLDDGNEVIVVIDESGEMGPTDTYNIGGVEVIPDPENEANITITR